jgi:hypothetical protein
MMGRNIQVKCSLLLQIFFGEKRKSMCLSVYIFSSPNLMAGTEDEETESSWWRDLGVVCRLPEDVEDIDFGDPEHHKQPLEASDFLEEGVHAGGSEDKLFGNLLPSLSLSGTHRSSSISISISSCLSFPVVPQLHEDCSGTCVLGGAPVSEGVPGQAAGCDEQADCAKRKLRKRTPVEYNMSALVKKTCSTGSTGSTGSTASVVGRRSASVPRSLLRLHSIPSLGICEGDSDCSEKVATTVDPVPADTTYSGKSLRPKYKQWSIRTAVDELEVLAMCKDLEALGAVTPTLSTCDVLAADVDLLKAKWSLMPRGAQTTPSERAGDVWRSFFDWLRSRALSSIGLAASVALALGCLQLSSKCRHPHAIKALCKATGAQAKILLRLFFMELRHEMSLCDEARRTQTVGEREVHLDDGDAEWSVRVSQARRLRLNTVRVARTPSVFILLFWSCFCFVLYALCFMLYALCFMPLD